MKIEDNKITLSNNELKELYYKFSSNKNRIRNNFIKELLDDKSGISFNSLFERINYVVSNYDSHSKDDLYTFIFDTFHMDYRFNLYGHYDCFMSMLFDHEDTEIINDVAYIKSYNQKEEINEIYEIVTDYLITKNINKDRRYQIIVTDFVNEFDHQTYTVIIN